MPASPMTFVTSANLPDLFSKNTEICFKAIFVSSNFAFIDDSLRLSDAAFDGFRFH